MEKGGGESTIREFAGSTEGVRSKQTARNTAKVWTKQVNREVVHLDHPRKKWEKCGPSSKTSHSPISDHPVSTGDRAKQRSADTPQTYFRHGETRQIVFLGSENTTWGRINTPEKIAEVFLGGISRGYLCTAHHPGISRGYLCTAHHPGISRGYLCTAHHPTGFRLHVVNSSETPTTPPVFVCMWLTRAKPPPPLATLYIEVRVGPPSPAHGAGHPPPAQGIGVGFVTPRSAADGQENPLILGVPGRLGFGVSSHPCFSGRGLRGLGSPVG